MIATAGRTALGVLLGAVLALPLTSIAHDLLPVHPPAAVSWAIAMASAAIMTSLVGVPGARLVAERGGLRRTAAVILGAALGAVPTARPLLQLLRSPTSPVAQLAWTLGEEDNAQIIGLAREVITDGPAGGVLAAQYGTGFVVPATTLMRMLGVPDPTLDPRLLAIHAFTLSTLLAVLTVAAAVGLAVLTNLRAVHPPRLLGAVGLSAVTAGATAAAIAVAVVLPMRTGFLTFVWGIAWISLGAAILPLIDRDVPMKLAAGAVIHVGVTTLLTVRSWPFIGVAALPGAALMASMMPLGRAMRAARRHPIAAAVLTATVAAATVAFLWNSALGEVLSYGLEALTISASGIAFDARIGYAVTAATVMAAALMRRRGWRGVLAVVGPTAAGWASWLGLQAAAQVLTGGELNYGGAKLLYGVVAIAGITAVPPLLTGWAGLPLRSAGIPLATAVTVGLLVASSTTVGTMADWEARLEPSEPPHAVAMIDAIERTTPELPVRCRPAPGTVVTPTSRWAAYFCVRWVEDALNGTDRSRGYRGDYLGAPEGTFDPIVAEATAAGHYGFAYVMPLGPGWFGWDGRS